jgi:hypothetical protein
MDRPGDVVALKGRRSMIRFYINSMRRGVMMSVHETAITWFALVLYGPSCGRRFSWQFKITFDRL